MYFEYILELLVTKHHLIHPENTRCILILGCLLCCVAFAELHYAVTGDLLGLARPRGKG
jgi:hypothetical protein